MAAQAIQVHDNRFDVFTSRLTQVELADDKSCAVLTIPLMHVGPNKKGLYWTPKMLKSVAPMFRGITFRYDLNGSEGSSHTPQKLSSPHFDIGWTYSDERGAWFEKDNGILWVKGEVTHPDIIKKLDRKTSDGKREINFASMGVLVEKSVCSICGKEHGMDGCEHTRNEIYDGEVCYSVPEKVKKALHVALTNDPADGEAEIDLPPSITSRLSSSFSWARRALYSFRLCPRFHPQRISFFSPELLSLMRSRDPSSHSPNTIQDALSPGTLTTWPIGKSIPKEESIFKAEVALALFRPSRSASISA